jgi:hypothetical protein
LVFLPHREKKDYERKKDFEAVIIAVVTDEERGAAGPRGKDNFLKYFLNYSCYTADITCTVRYGVPGN